MIYLALAVTVHTIIFLIQINKSLYFKITTKVIQCFQRILIYNSMNIKNWHEEENRRRVLEKSNQYYL